MKRAALLSALLCGVLAAGAGRAGAAGGNYVLQGGTWAEQRQVASALAASAFDFGVIPLQVTVHLVRGVESHSQPGHVWLDTDLLNAGAFSWAVVQDEFAHQIDFLLFDDDVRARLTARLGGRAWCHTGSPGLPHAAYACERFASTLVWSFWPSKLNAYRPKAPRDESAAMRPAQFRTLVRSVVSERLFALGYVG